MTKELDHSWLRQASTDGGEVQALYDQWAHSYDETVKEWGYNAPTQAAKMLFADMPPDAFILDVGCGTGLTGVALREAGFVGKVDGIDLSPASLEEARKRNIYQTLRAVDLQALPLPIEDGTYDALLCAGVLTYISNDAQLWPEFARIVKPGGVVIATQRTDYFKERNYDALLKHSTAYFSHINTSDPAPYLPGNEQYADEVGIHYITAKVT